MADPNPKTFFGLKRPCSNCPFRKDVPPYLRKARVKELKESLKTSAFDCHKTLDYEDGEGLRNRSTKHCAGALVLLEKTKSRSQLMQIGERFGLYDPAQVDLSAPVYESFEEMAEAQLD